ncbi:hypothetical protein, conserved [Eimeria necatrix]|uniref:Uncharacterized protein n=1 Tax=Eimeria necatrix TaxID=51315 RepID=U6N043_9EIME|nr:hypothetical protein, conserved [Eimeria necatrix]CDJ68668.1 hypothetical protein, conserved [Eimeria necatrix]
MAERRSHRVACCGFLLLLASICACSATPAFPGLRGVPLGASEWPSPAPRDKLGNITVKAKGARLLKAGHGISSTRGDLRINGFNAHLRFNNVQMEVNKAAGIAGSRKIKMPFTRQQAQLATGATAAALSARADAPNAEESSQGGELDERRQRVARILRAILPTLKQRVIVLRLRQQGAASQEAVPGSSSTEPQGNGLHQVSGEADTGNQQNAESESLRMENERLRRMVKALSMAVRGLIRHTLRLQQRLAAQKQQPQPEGEDSSKRSLGEQEEGNVSQSGASAPFRPEMPSEMPSVTESPESFRKRKAILLQQYPPTES